MWGHLSAALKYMQQFILSADVAEEHWRRIKCIYRLAQTFWTWDPHCPTRTVHRAALNVGFCAISSDSSAPVWSENSPPMTAAESGKQGECGSDAAGVLPGKAFEHQYKHWYQCLRLMPESEAPSVWDFIFVGEVVPQASSVWLGALACPALQSGSLTVFMELCFVVSVVSRSSPRPCKEPHRGAAQPHCAPTAIPELTHLSSSSMSELQIYVPGPDGTLGRLDVSLRGLFPGSKQLFLVLWYQFIIVKKNLFVISFLKVNVTWSRMDAGQIGSDSNFHVLLFKLCNSEHYGSIIKLPNNLFLLS